MDTTMWIVIAGVIIVFLLLRAFMWWYWGIYEMLDRMDKTNNLLTDIREILKKSTGVEIDEANDEKKY